MDTSQFTKMDTRNIFAPETNKGKEPMRSEEAGSSSGGEDKEPLICEDPVSPTDNNEEDGKATTPPRISFGIELEFLIAECDGKDPDADIADKLPPLIGTNEAEAAVRELFQSKGLKVRGEYQERPDPNIPSEFFIVGHDSTVSEKDQIGTETGYQWGSVEIATPAQYASDEAFDLIRLVVSLLTSNFRCRVNKSCGFHVHFSNGFDRIEGRHAKKFGALLWAAEPMFSTLHPPERAFAQWSKSIRRANGRDGLVSGQTADQARQGINMYGACILGREYGRQRNYGEDPEPVICESGSGDLRVWDPEKDTVNWLDDGYEPFQRPVKQGAPPPPIENPRLLNSGRKNIKFGPPSLHHVAKPTQPYAYNFERQSGRSDSHLPADIVLGLISDRDSTLSHDRAAAAREAHMDSWFGIQEVLSADVGTHQVIHLIYGTFAPKNWNTPKLGFNPETSTIPAWIPNEHIKPEFLPQRQRDDKNASRKIGPWEAAHNRKCDKLTVESREAAGTLDADWIVTWARICVGFLEFARDAEPNYYMSVLAKCANATNYFDRSYDIVDLLRDMGLFSEANHCDRRLARQEEAWFDCIHLKKRDLAEAERDLSPRMLRRVKQEWLDERPDWSQISGREMPMGAFERRLRCMTVEDLAQMPGVNLHAPNEEDVDHSGNDQMLRDALNWQSAPPMASIVEGEEAGSFEEAGSSELADLLAKADTSGEATSSEAGPREEETLAAEDAGPTHLRITN